MEENVGSGGGPPLPLQAPCNISWRSLVWLQDYVIDQAFPTLSLCFCAYECLRVARPCLLGLITPLGPFLHFEYERVRLTVWMKILSDWKPSVSVWILKFFVFKFWPAPTICSFTVSSVTVGRNRDKEVERWPLPLRNRATNLLSALGTLFFSAFSSVWNVCHYCFCSFLKLPLLFSDLYFYVSVSQFVLFRKCFMKFSKV